MIPNLAAMKFAILAALYGIQPEPPPITPGPPVVPLAVERPAVDPTSEPSCTLAL